MVFVKAPRKGTVKTRLARDVGDETATRLYRGFVLDVLDLIRNDGAREVVICHAPPDASGEIREWLGPMNIYRPQSGGDLGQRMCAAFRKAFADGVDRALLMGTDLPDLPPEVVDSADAALRSADAVLGPSRDGGYYLIGFNRNGFEPAVFREIPWSTDAVFRLTERILTRRGRRFRVLPVWRDVDDVADLRNLMDRLRIHGRAVHTRRCLKEHPLKRKD